MFIEMNNKNIRTNVVMKKYVRKFKMRVSRELIREKDI